MTVVTSVKEVGPCRKELTIEVPAAALEEQRAQVIRDIRRHVELPGFRKGKVPVGVVSRRFADEIRKETLENLLPEYWEKAREEQGLDPLLPPDVTDVGEPEEGEPLTFTAAVEVRPEIELGDLDGYELPEVDVEPTDDEIQESLDDLRRRVADWVEADRPAARGDRVVADIRELPPAGAEDEDEVDGEGASEDNAPDTVTVELGDERVWEELSVSLTGLKAGQSARFSRRMPNEAGEQTERHFEATAARVEERDLPPLDDDFAEKIGFDSLEELKTEVTANLQRQKEQAARQERETALLDQLRESHPLELPQGVVSHEVEHLLQDYAQRLAQNGVDVENADIDWRKLGDDVRPQAEKQVHARLLLDAVADDRGIEVTEEELNKALSALARAENTNVPTLRQTLERDGRLDGFRKKLRRNQTVRRLLGDDVESSSDEAADGGSDT